MVADTRSPAEATAHALQALSRVIDAGQRMVADRVELLSLEVKSTAQSVGRSAAFAAAGGTFALLGWVSLMAAAVVFLSEWLGLAGALALVGVVHVCVGAALFMSSRSSARVEAPLTAARGPHRAPA